MDDSWSTFELFQSLNTLTLSKDIRRNWNFEYTLAENYKYVSATIMKCIFTENKKD